MVKDIIPDIIEPVIQSISREIKLKNEKMKGHILQLLTTLALVCPNELVYFLGGMMKDLESSLKENNVLKLFISLELCHYCICNACSITKKPKKHRT